MGYIVIIFFNIIILGFAYHKFVKAIRKKSEESILAYKREAALTVNQFNAEFDRNLTLLENRSKKLENLMKDADEYINNLLNLNKELDVEKVNNLVEEVKLELDRLSIDQKTLKDTIVRERIHATARTNSFKKENLLDLDNDEAPVDKISTKSISSEAKKELPDISTENNENSYKNIPEEDKAVDFKKLLHSNSGKVRIPSVQNNLENSQEEKVNSPSDIVQKAYIKTRNLDTKDTEINSLLDKTLNYVEKNDKSQNNPFETELSNAIGKSFIFSEKFVEPENEKKTKPTDRASSSATGLQAKVFELLEMGKSIDEICAALSISKGAAELHYHIYKAKRIAT